MFIKKVGLFLNKYLRKRAIFGLVVISLFANSLLPYGVVNIVYGQGTTPTTSLFPDTKYTQSLGQNTALPNDLWKQKPNYVPNKTPLGSAKEKLDMNLLKLIDNNFLLPNQSHAQVVSQMEEQKQFVDKQDSVKNIDKRIDNKTHNDLVYVYIRLENTVQTSVIDNYVWKVTDRDEKEHMAVAFVETNKLETLASLNGVKSIRAVLAPITNSGSVITEGDIIHQTDDVRSTYSQSGSGIKIGVISDGVDNIATSKSTGDLPNGVTVLGNAVGGDEGTAMLEIIYDMVPNASLYFHDCGNNVVAFNSAIDDLIAAGANVIVDDIGWISEPFFEDGTVASHVTSVLAANNIVYVSSAGNAAGEHYQGDYYNNGSNYHDFSRGADPTYKNLYVNIPSGANVRIVLQWNDSFGSSGNDYDLYLDRSDGSGLLASSLITQNGNDDPLEYISYTNVTGSTIIARIWANNYLGLATMKTLEVFIYSSGGAYNYTNNITTTDSIFGHPAVPNAIAVGAIDASDVGNDTIETFSSLGPVTIIGEAQRTKPDISGIDGVSVTGAGGFSNPFFGTSAAAPHIAAIVAQLWGQFPTATASQIKSQILSTAVDLGTAGLDNIFGYGRADSLLAFQAVPTTPTASPTGGVHNGSIYVTLSSTDAASIRYTTNGSTPTCSSATYSSPISIAVTTTLKSIACNSFGIGSTATETYTINTPISAWYIPNGSSVGTFDTYLIMMNPTGSTAAVDITFYPTTGNKFTKSYSITANKRFTVLADTDFGSNKTFTTKITSDQAILAERAMYWDANGEHWAGGHNIVGSPDTATSWYFAEGSTMGTFKPYYYVFNPNTATTSVTVSYLTDGVGTSNTYSISAESQLEIDVRNILGADKEFVTKIVGTNPVIAERETYWDVGSITSIEGHATLGTNTLSTTWYLAEGSTKTIVPGSILSTYIIIGNPNNSSSDVTLTYMLVGGTNIVKNVTLPAGSKIVYNAIDDVGGEVSFSSKVTSTIPVVVERSMYWGGTSSNPWELRSGHNSMATTTTSSNWLLPEGSTKLFGSNYLKTYVLMQNPNSEPVTVTVTFMIQDGGANIVKTYVIPEMARYTINTFLDTEVGSQQSFATKIEVTSDPTKKIIAERAMYWDIGTTTWKAGHNSLGIAQ